MAAIKSRRRGEIPPGAPKSKHGPGLSLSQAKLPPSFRQVPPPVPPGEPEVQTTMGGSGPVPPARHPSVYVGGGLDESLMSEAEQQLQKLLARQLDTSHSSLANALGHVREYTPAVVYQPLTKEMGGLHTLSQYISKEEELGKLDQLRQLGLTEQEIEMKLKEEGLSDLQPSSAKRNKLGAEPRAQQERLEVLQKKISEREKMLQEPTTYTGVRQMSRHAMEVERSLFRGSSAVGNHLLHLTQEENGRRTHEVAYPKSIMPSNTPTVEEEAAPEESSHDVLPLPVQVIERNRLTEMEIRALPRFKDYTHGTPSKLLYLKNLDPRVSVDDLQAMFGGVTSSKPHIRVMTGRMRGQAFAEFESIESATKAMQITNGYLIREKPIIISYGRTKTNSGHTIDNND